MSFGSTIKMTSHKHRGAFIVFEGIDRCGKSTQTRLLQENLQKSNISTQLMRFPNRESETGKKINAYLTQNANIDDKEIHLLFSQNRWEAKDHIIEMLQQGTTLIVDRYAYSGVAFSAAKGLDVQWCKNPDRGLPRPDVVIYLQMSVEDATKRGNYGEERYEKEDFQKKVKELFESHTIKDDSWVSVNANQPIEEIALQILGIAKNTIQNCANKPISPLWPEPDQ